MKKLLVLIPIVLLCSLALAEEFEIDVPCIETIDCIDFCDQNDLLGDCYCEEELCFIADDVDVETDEDLFDEDNETEEDAAEDVISNETSSISTSALLQDIENLQFQLATLSEQIRDIETSVGSLETNFFPLQQQLDVLQGEVQELQQKVSKLNKDTRQQANTISVGLAGLQDDLTLTQGDVDVLEEEVSREQAYRRFIVWMILIAIMMAVGLGIVYYVRRRKSGDFDPKMLQYITRQIQKGKKYDVIKAGLLRAGWSEKVIFAAYKYTTQQNYQRYLSHKKPSKQPEREPSKQTSMQASGQSAKPVTDKKKLPHHLSQHSKKILIIAIIAVVALAGALLLLKATTGKAIFYQQLVDGDVNGTTGEVTYDISCTPPHILTPSGDGCCVDENDNGLCDYLERREVEEIDEEGTCTDNAQCGPGGQCIDGKCDTVLNLYNGESCERSCNYYIVNVSTSDDEEYLVGPGKGSYTAVGALEWKALAAPDFCQGKNPIVPFAITKKSPSGVLQDSIITLQKGQASSVITHPNIPSVSFKLKLENFYYRCEG